MLKLHNMTAEDAMKRRQEQLSWSIWGYCREHRHSMASEIHIKKIDSAISNHVKELNEKIAELEKKIDLLLVPPPKLPKPAGPSKKLLRLRELSQK